MTYNKELAADIVACGERGSRETNDKLYPDVVKGNPGAVQKMIESNMSLVIYQVDGFISRQPQYAYLRDDIISEAFVGLTTAVNRLATGNAEVEEANPNPSAYIAYWIKKHIGEAVESELFVTLETVAKHSQEGRQIVQHVELPIGHDVEVDPRAEIELRDLIESCCVNEDERFIVKMREHGYVDSEIAEMLNISTMTVNRVRRELHTRFIKKQELINQ